MLTQTMVEEALAGAEEAGDQEVVFACHAALNIANMNGNFEPNLIPKEVAVIVWRGVHSYI